jgi:hypothetical protein
MHIMTIPSLEDAVVLITTMTGTHNSRACPGLIINRIRKRRRGSHTIVSGNNYIDAGKGFFAKSFHYGKT